MPIPSLLGNQQTGGKLKYVWVNPWCNSPIWLYEGCSSTSKCSCRTVSIIWMAVCGRAMSGIIKTPFNSSLWILLHGPGHHLRHTSQHQALSAAAPHVIMFQHWLLWNLKKKGKKQHFYWCWLHLEVSFWLAIVDVYILYSGISSLDHCILKKKFVIIVYTVTQNALRMFKHLQPCSCELLETQLPQPSWKFSLF